MKPSTEDLIVKAIAFGVIAWIVVWIWPTVVGILALVGLFHVVKAAMENR